MACARTVDELSDIYDEHVWRVYAFFAYRLGSREDAEDLTQATFERAARAFGRYDPARSKPLTWLLAIAQNLLIDHYRRRPERPEQPLDLVELDEVARAVDPADQLRFAPDPEIAEALAILTDREREIVALRYGADLTNPEIAALKNLSLSNVQQILSRSLRRMRALLDDRAATGSAPEPRAPEPGERAARRR